MALLSSSGRGVKHRVAAAGHEEDASTAKLLGGEDDFIHAIFSATRRLAACDITSTSTTVVRPPADPGGDSLRGMIQWKPGYTRFFWPLISPNSNNQPRSRFWLVVALPGRRG